MKYYLKENQLTDENNYAARILTEKSHDLDAIIQLMLEKRNVLSRTDINAVLTAFFQIIEECIRRGENINLPIFNLAYSITGVFDEDTDVFDPEKHQINVNLTNGTQVRDAIEQVQLTKVDSVETDPVISSFIDIATQSKNDKLTKNSLFEIHGKRLKIAGEDAGIGFFFVAEDGTETKVTQIADNGQKKIVGLIPDLAIGKYRIRIKTQSTFGAYTTKGIKETTSKFSLTIS
ncbi:DNA-binding domain-containing protein [Marinifilum sp.]|uniref:DNA-binding domain-containing protein n=1 Tax=Marinifilum sp. TaxID=2033137 RepID=UPI003BAC1965